MFTIAIAGSTCSGKTTLSRKLAASLPGCTVIPLDNYYKKRDLSFEERASINHDLPDELDWQLLENQLKKLKEGKNILMPVYSFRQHARTDQTIDISPPSTLILEGIHSFQNSIIRKFLDLKIFLDTTLEDRLSRRIARDLKERADDIEYIKWKFSSQTEKIYQEVVWHYKSLSDFTTSDLNAAEKFILSRLSDEKQQ